MSQGLIHQKGHKPQFSGHETFALRYGWLKKAHDAVKRSNGRDIFKEETAIGQLGLGKNMVASMRHWAFAAGIIRDQDGSDEPLLKITALGKLIFEDDGLDPYTENTTTPWLLHWNLCTGGKKTTWNYAFSHFPSVNEQFDRETLANGVIELARDKDWPRTSENTIKRDVSCFLRTYAVSPYQTESTENRLESPLTELGLLHHAGRRDGFRFNRGPKPSLPPGVFCYALSQFWDDDTRKDSVSLSLEALTRAPESPGRVFLLDEDEMADRLAKLEEFTKGHYRWSETAGLKQVFRTRRLSDQERKRFIKRDYLKARRGEGF